MAFAAQEEEVFDVYGGNDFQYSNFEYNPNKKDDTTTRKGRSSVPNYMKPTQSSSSRKRASSADARPQYHRRQQITQTKSYEDRLLDQLLQQKFEYDLDVPTQQQQQQAVYKGPHMQLSTQDGDHFMDPNFDEPVERIHFERNNPFAGGATTQHEQPLEQPPDMKTPQHLQQQQQQGTFDPFGGGWSPEDDKRRWDMPYNPSATYPATTTNTSTQQQQQQIQETKSFPDSSAQYPAPTSQQQQPLKVQVSKTFPASNHGQSIAAESNKSEQRTDWKSNVLKTTMVLKPKTKAVKEQVKAITSRLSSAMSRSSRSQIPTAGKTPQRSKSQPAPVRNRNQTVADAGIIRQKSNPKRPTPSARSRSKDDYGSFDVEYDFYGDGFAQSKNHSPDGGSNADVFQVISRRGPKAQRAPQIKPDVVATSYTSKRPSPVSYTEYLAKSKVPSARGAFSKISPTSVMDVNSHSNVHWSQNLSQAPTPRTQEDNPQSILRGRQHPGNNHYQVGHANSSTPVDFIHGNEISPIKSRPSPAYNRTPYEAEMHAMPVPSADESDMMSVAYNEFIESVAAVVIQTTVRRFLARLQVDKMRVQVAAARKYRYNRKRIEGKSKPKQMIVLSVQEQRRIQQEAITNARMEYQLFDFAAIRIQSVFRGWFVRDIIKIEHYCATIIQKNARAFIYRNQYQYDLFRIIIAQSVIRRFLVCRNLYIAPDPEVRRVLDFAATMIQAGWRGFAAEMRYFQDYRDILISQSVARRWLAIRNIKAMQFGSRNTRKPTNRFGKYGGARRSFGNLPQENTAQTSKWSNTRNVPWKPVSSTNKHVVKESVSNSKGLDVGMSSVAKRRSMFESKRLNTVQQEEQSRQRAAAEKAELKAMQRRVGVQTSPATQSIQPQRAKSFSGRIQGKTSKWGSDSRKQGGRVSSFESGSVVASDVETEVQSNRTSRLLQGWRDREKSGSLEQRHSFDMISTSRTKEMENKLGLSKYLGGKGNESQPFASAAGMENAKGCPSIQEVMRAKRNPTESARIERMEDVFQRVGLMRPVNRPRRNFDNGNQSKLERTQSSPLRNPARPNTSQPKWIKPSHSHGDSPKTERKLFHDEPDNVENDKAGLKIWRNTRQPLRGNINRAPLPPRQQSNGAERRSFGAAAASPTNQRSKNLMNSLGLNTSYASEASTDVSDMENSPSPAFMKRFQKQPSSPIQKANLFGAPQQQPKAMTPSRPVFSQYQLHKQAERSQEQQTRIDGIHAVFEKVGLMKCVA